MPSLVVPWIENLHSIRDTITGWSVDCTAKAISAPMEWINSVASAPGVNGGFDALGNRRATMKPRNITVTLVKVYDTTAGENFSTATYDLERVLKTGNPLELEFVEDDGTVWFWDVRAISFDKKMALNYVGFCEFPLTFIAADPFQRAQYKTGVLLLDNGMFLDDGWFLDVDPDNFVLTGTLTQHVIVNTGSAADEAPKVDLQGPIIGPIFCTYLFEDGNSITWQYTLNIAATETVSFDAEQPEVISSIATVDAYHAFLPPVNSNSWGRINPGTTIIGFSYTSVGTGANATISWLPRK